MKNILLVTSLYVAAVVGAGFASGQEILAFFVRYGNLSVLGVFAAAVMFGFFAFAILEGCRHYGCSSFDRYAEKISGKIISVVIRILSGLFLFCVFCAMLAGGGEVGGAMFGVPKSAAITIIAAFCLVIFSAKRRGFVMFNGILGAVITAGILFACLYILKYREMYVFANMAVKVGISSVSYVSYNLLTSAVTLAAFGSRLKSRRECVAAGVFSGIVIGAMMLGIWCVISIYYGKISLGALPMLTLMLRQNPVLSAVYGLILLAAMLTTAVASGYGVIDMVGGFKLKGNLVGVFLVVLGYLFSGLGFEGLVDNAYRMCGYFGLLLLVIVAVDVINRSKNRKKSSILKRNE